MTILAQREKQKLLKQARYKLKRIIELYGDENGERNKPQYLAHILEEITSAYHISDLCYKMAYATSYTKNEIEQLIGKPTPEGAGNPHLQALLYHNF